MAEEHWPYRRIKRPPRMQVWLDGKFLFEEEPIFSLADWNSAFHIGFKVLFRAYGSELRHFNRYYKHLEACLTQSQFPSFAFLSGDMIRHTANALLQKNRHPRNALISATFFLRSHPDTNDAMPWTTSLLLEAEGLSGQFFDPQIPPAVIVSYKELRRDVDPLSAINWLGIPAIRFAMLYARQHGCTDSLLYDNNNFLLQTAERHIYCLKDNTVFTPPLSQGLVQDPFREILAIAILQGGYRIVEKALTKENFLEAEEIFMGSTRYGIEPVKRLDNKIIFGEHRRVRELIKILNTLFFNELQ